MHPSVLTRLPVGTITAMTMACLCIISPGLHAADTPPNVVVILMDDAGYSDFGFMGSEILTPNMDRLRSEGVLITQFYNNAQCVPTRGALLHGQSAPGSGYGSMRSHPNPESVVSDDPFVPLRRGALSIAEVLKHNGYQTFMTGKWHLGGHPALEPVARGFDHFYGITGGASQFFKAKLNAVKVRRDGWKRDGTSLTYPDDFSDDFYASDAFNDQAAEMIRQSDPDRPFFLYLAHTAPHWPLQAPEADIARYADRYANTPWQELRQQRFERLKILGLLPENAQLPAPWPRSLEPEAEHEIARENRMMATYAAMLEVADRGIGRVLEAIETRGDLENTLIFLLSDNGADTVHGDGWMQVNNTPFRLCKTFAHEGGARTPLVARWPGKIPAGATNLGQYGHVQDLLPSILDATGASLPNETPRSNAPRPLEGQSLLPALKDPKYANNVPIAIERMGNEMIRNGDWKLVRRYNFAMDDKARGSLFFTEGPREGKWELYNLAEDPTETTNLAEENPEKAAALKAQFQAWSDRVGLPGHEDYLKEIGRY